MTRPQKDGFEFYFTLDTHCKVRDYAIRNDTGEGFEQFIQRNVEGQRSGGNYPDYWLFQYTIPDDVLLRIRQQERLIGPDFLQNSLPILLEEGVAPQRIVRLRDAAFCWQMNISYLSPEAELERLRHHDGYERAMFCFGEGMKRLPSFDTLTAVETRQGLLLFTDTPRGTSAMKRCGITICCTSSTLNYRIRSCGCIGFRSSMPAGRSMSIYSGSTVTIKTGDGMPSTRSRPKHSPRKHCWRTPYGPTRSILRQRYRIMRS